MKQAQEANKKGLEEEKKLRKQASMPSSSKSFENFKRTPRTSTKYSSISKELET